MHKMKLAMCRRYGIPRRDTPTFFRPQVAYLIAFGVQLWWIVDTKETMPAPAYILCGGYVIMLLTALIMLIGLALKKTRYLLAWLLVMIVFFFPEMGMVLFMSIYHWNIESDYGLGDLIFYICRAGLNLVSLICVQSLHATWREEKFTLHRLDSFNLKVGPSVLRNGMADRGYRAGSISYTNGVQLAAPALIRSVSSASQYAPARQHGGGRSQFNAAFYGMNGGPVVRTQSSIGINDYPSLGYEPPHLVYVPRYSTQSLDRRKYMRGSWRAGSADALNLAGPLPAPPCHCWLAHGRRQPHESRSSLGAESDSYRYRDVAL
ncbi:uncharacterized protein LOC119107098 isoform X2 [Pollicipes pollicipes]|uniref:uncharacterized protein LOC119107098 isoform X2 n=1 Tax=Pollicipes pollicipes TaxID=41117 RepID=UPI0018849FD9|nr:uncharacterized protein LOC119107098 isoform X2 [Pollicipes pollicipes]